MYELHDVSDEDVIPFLIKDRNVFVVLVQRYEQKLDRYIRRLGITSRQDREDVLQNIFVKTYKNIQGFDTLLSFSAWIYRIAHNEAISFFRAKKVRPEGHLVDDGEQVLLSILDENDFTKDLDKKIDARRVALCVEKLDEIYRDIIILRYFEDREYKEISGILKIPEGTVATLLHRAKKKLKILLEKDQNKYEQSTQ
ncbi:MAG: RNA polymerase sigma factor [Minisyncoccia bacterium]